MQAGEFSSEFIGMLKNVENAQKKGFTAKTGRWASHESPEDGAHTVGYGHKLPLGVKYDENNGPTTDQIEKLLNDDLVKHSKQAKKVYEEYIRKNYDANNPRASFDMLDKKSKELLIEKQFNSGNLKQWPKMMKYVYDNDRDKALIEARGKYTPDPKYPHIKKWDDRRNNIRENYFREKHDNVGGIDLYVSSGMLSIINQELSKHQSIIGISFNELTNSMVLLTEPEENNQDTMINVKGILLEHLAVALLITYSTNNQYEPSFSLDPWEQTNPSGPYMRKVYYPDEFLHEQLLQGTTFGEIMFEADWILKQLSLGLSVEQIEPVLKTQPMIYPNNSCRTYGIKSLPEISLEQASEADISSTWHRLWIVNEVILSTESSFEDKTNTTGSCLVFGNIKMNVKAKHMIVNSQSGQLEDAPDTDEQTAAHTFAAMMGNNYDFIANHFPILKQLKELTKCVALAKWLYLHNVPIDIELLKGIVNKNRTNYSSRVPSLTRMMETSVGNTIHKQSIFGGVTLKLSVNPKVISSKTYHDIQQNLDQRQIVVNLNSVGVKAVAISLPFHYNKEEVCCICQSILSWKELQIWHLALHPNYAKVVGNYYLKNSDFLCLLHNPLVCK